MQHQNKLALIGSLAFVFIVLAAALVLFIGAPFVSAPSDPPETPATTALTDPQKAEGVLGIALPSDTDVLTLVDGDIAAQVTGATVLDMEGARTWIDAELVAQGGRLDAPWAILTSDTSDRHSATYVLNQETWSIMLSEKGERTQFDVTRQY